MRLTVAAEETRSLAVAAASDLVFCLDELVQVFKEDRPGVSVKVTTGASGTLTAQIARGAPFDLLMAADVAYPKQLIQSGHASSDLTIYGSGRLVLWTTNPNVDVTAGLPVLATGSVTRIAIANPDHAPYGRAAKAALVTAKLWPQVQPKIVLGENVAQAAQFIESGHVDVGIVALSVVLGPERKAKGKYLGLSRSEYPSTDQGAVLTKRGAQNEDARAFLKFLGTDRARRILKQYGFDTPQP